MSTFSTYNISAESQLIVGSTAAIYGTLHVSLDGSLGGSLFKVTNTNYGVDQINVTQGEIDLLANVVSIGSSDGNGNGHLLIQAGAGADVPNLIFNTGTFGDTLQILGTNYPEISSLSTGWIKFLGNIAFTDGGEQPTDSRVLIIGSTTSASSYAVKIQDSLNNNLFYIRDDGYLDINNGLISINNTGTMVFTGSGYSIVNNTNALQMGYGNLLSSGTYSASYFSNLQLYFEYHDDATNTGSLFNLAGSDGSGGDGVTPDASYAEIVAFDFNTGAYGGIQVYPNRITTKTDFIGNIFAGIEYDKDYSANYTTYSLVTYGDLLSHSGGGSSSITGATNGLSAYPGGVGLGGLLDTDVRIYGGTYSPTFYIGIDNDGAYSPVSNFAVNVIGQITLQTNDGINSLTVDDFSNSVYMTSISSPNIAEVLVSYESGVSISSGDIGNPSLIQLTTSTQSLNSDDSSINNYMTIQDSSGSKGLVYMDDYSANFTNESLVSKRYVLSLAGGSSSNTGATNGLYLDSGYIGLGGNITQYTSINVDSNELAFGLSAGSITITDNNTDIFFKFGKGVLGTTAGVGFEVTPDPLTSFAVYRNVSGFSASVLFYQNDNPGGYVFFQSDVLQFNSSAGSSLLMSQTSMELSFVNGGSSSLIQQSNSGIIIQDNYYSRGVVYADDYSANFVDNSLVSKLYVDSLSLASPIGNTGSFLQSNGATSNWNSNVALRSFGITVDGGGAVVTTGSYGFTVIPYAGTITSWYVVGDQSGSIDFDLLTGGTSIINGGNEPLLSTTQRNNADISGWASPNISQNQEIEFVVNSADTVQRVNLIVNIIVS